MIFRSIVVAAGVFGVAAVAHTAEISNKPASIAPSQGCCEPYRYVYAEFWYGDRKVVAPVRHGPVGDEVMLPGEIWVPCQLSCEYTLRKQTLDYLESQGAGSGRRICARLSESGFLCRWLGPAPRIPVLSAPVTHAEPRARRCLLRHRIGAHDPVPEAEIETIVPVEANVVVAVVRS